MFTFLYRFRGKFSSTYVRFTISPISRVADSIFEYTLVLSWSWHQRGTKISRIRKKNQFLKGIIFL